MAAHSLSRTLAVAASLNRGLFALESERTRSQCVGAIRAVRGLRGGTVAGCFERVELGRGRMLRRTRGGGDGKREAAQAEPPTLERENQGLPEGYMEEMQQFLWKDLVHLFDEQGIDKSMYDQKVEFRDPITKYDSLNGYLTNIAVLRTIFRPIFDLHSVKQVRSVVFLLLFSVGLPSCYDLKNDLGGFESVQTGPYEITTRWTMTMNFWIVLWQPQLIFTGVSIMRVNPETGKFNAHIVRSLVLPLVNLKSCEKNEIFDLKEVDFH
jgi:hypothetical protein